MAYILAIATGAALAPALLPWLPGRAIAIKGAVMGSAAGTMLVAFFSGRLAWLGMLALTLFIMAVSSCLTVNTQERVLWITQRVKKLTNQRFRGRKER